MSRRSAGLVGVWAEMQRQQQRLQAAEARRQRDADAHARRQRSQAATAYKEMRHADARRRSSELEEQVAALQRILVSGCRAPGFSASSLLRAVDIPPFDPGQLAWPVPMPDPARYQAQGGGWTASRRAQAEADARARFEYDWHAAQAAEGQRQRDLAARQREYEEWAQGRRGEVRRHNDGVGEVAEGMRRGEPEAVVEYFTAALYASTAWPDDFPRRISAAYDRNARQLVLDWELPGYGMVPEAKGVKYVVQDDRDREIALPVTRRRGLYREVLAQCSLLVLHQLHLADEHDVLESVAFNGFVDDNDPATGRRAQIVLTSVVARRSVLAGLRLDQVDPVSCLTDALRGQLASRPDQLASVRAGRRPDDVGQQVLTFGAGVPDLGDEPDLHTMDPIAFEGLVAELFRAMGMRAVTTQRSGDGGVDIDAVDPAPIRGGKIVVQVKRYRATVPPTAVRDLYGTVQDAGANKGVLVTTSGFGPGSYAFAHGKPLELVGGAELVDLLHRHGLRGRLGDAARPAPAGGPAPAGASDPTLVMPSPAAPPAPVSAPTPAADPAPADHNILGMSWSGRVVLDVCALVCRGGRVLGDDHFVFFNNPATPDGSVRTVRAAPPDKAALRVAFDALPAGADRLVLVAAVDPEVNPDADLAGFTDARIRLRDSTGAELGELEVSDGRAGETALVLGSFRRRASGDWDFVLGGKGYPDGLARLIGDFGIEVE
ncbi:restriction endonuclease [Streptomyces sp. NPDC093252]|uniref:restriction endonuclease n=1 Tax=Streptomyces sp. NPDC093252 TaxID=3154980 RepID=UPI003443DC60